MAPAAPAAAAAAAAAPAIAEAFAPAIVAWQRAHGRHGLPWHGVADPYRVWLSEVMLQQTQVSVVLAYWPRFLDRFPDVATLAAASLDDVLAAWSGLGYYSRARNLHRAAQAVVATHGGVFPRHSEQLATLPGIGRSTAAAVAAFAFGERAAILDGNVKRVLARVLAFAGDLASAREVSGLWSLATSLLPADAADMPAYTQGLMDLGATVCLPRAPRCLVCPVAALCAARRAGEPERYPVKTRRTARRAETTAWLELRHGERVFLVQRPPRGVWAGLWSLPELATLADLDVAITGWPGEANGWLRSSTSSRTATGRFTRCGRPFLPRRRRGCSRPSPSLAGGALVDARRGARPRPASTAPSTPGASGALVPDDRNRES
jgi:A/G-specific adenine glycosylase